ncbi:MAG: toll/interleukin-1 receptor domain-containing protein [Anaerolineae bacterium]|jgi:hypothetical protein
MTQILISHSRHDAACADQIRGDLQAQDYVVWQDKQNLAPGDVSYPQVIETGIQSSAALIVVWSANAARSEWVEREILFAQRLKEPIFPVVTDGTDLPITLINVQSITSAPPCADAVAQLLPHLPPPDSQDVLIALSEQLAHPHIRERKAGLQRAAALLERPEYRQKVLAQLEHVARVDLMPGVRAQAQAVLDADAQKGLPPSSGEASRHVFGVRCPNGHVTYFDKRHVCPASDTVVRDVVRRAEVELDEIHLKCAQCDAEMVAPVNCEGYK